jgi:uncharacterized protein (TIGR02271 family)
MNYEKIVTLYDTSQHAEAARQNLESAGFSPSEISMISSKTLSLTGDKLREPGLWHRLFGRDIQPHEARLYGQAIENGGSVLTVRVPENDVPRATNILRSHQSVDLRERAVEQGLLSSTAMPKTSTAATDTRTTATDARTMATTTRPATMAAGRSLGEEEVLRLAEEELNVGKRQIDDGMTRVRRFVIETPVEAQVTLHEEHAQIIRRAITDPSSISDVDWGDRTIEVRETAEEPVINKSCHITEEVVIRREATDNVRTVKDKVRKQQVEVDRVTGTGRAGTSIRKQ